jgi:hypothetical protein
MDLMLRVRGVVILAHWAFSLYMPIRRLVTMSQFADGGFYCGYKNHG